LSNTHANSRPDNERPALPVRVLIVAPSLAILGGQAVQANRLLSLLSDEKEIEVAFLPVNPRLPGALGKLQSIKYARTILTSVAYVTSLLMQVRKHDVLHIFSASYFSFLLAPTPALLIAKLFGKQTILNYRSGEAEDHLTRSLVAVSIMKLADAIIVPSQYLVDVFQKFGLRSRWIFNFVQLDQFRWRERKPLRPVFLSNRNFESHYNVACTLRAFGRIKKKYPTAEMIVVGDGPLREELHSLARELKLQSVKFVGAVPQAQMPELYKATDIYLNCSDIDNMPGSIIEAFACGLPVVTTNAGGIPYIVTDQETGLLIQCGDDHGIAHAALHLLEDEQLADSIIQRARQECDKYQWAAVRQQWVDAYIGLARRTPPSLTIENGNQKLTTDGLQH
jgi:glycosyltransferase involved in cell wall biosynthesis